MTANSPVSLTGWIHGIGDNVIGKFGLRLFRAANAKQHTSRKEGLSSPDVTLAMNELVERYSRKEDRALYNPLHILVYVQQDHPVGKHAHD